ncbi:hypothetical protein JTB14_000499 [Gonioctena quinquepunctata]|nr:hypothetical protein JTB14_000499 [Gonioctena quinquepunctata]
MKNWEREKRHLSSKRSIGLDWINPSNSSENFRKYRILLEKYRLMFQVEFDDYISAIGHTLTNIKSTCDDASSADYINRNAKDAAYNELLQRLEERGLKSGLAPLKRKIKSLRDTYRSEIYKIKKSKKSGAGADDVYKPRLGSSCTSGYLLYNVNPSDPLADGDIYQLLKPNTNQSTCVTKKLPH